MNKLISNGKPVLEAQQFLFSLIGKLAIFPVVWRCFVHPVDFSNTYCLPDQRQVPVCCTLTHVTATSSVCQPNFPGCTTALMNSARFYSARTQLSALIWRCVFQLEMHCCIILHSCTTCFRTVNWHNACTYTNKHRQ